MADTRTPFETGDCCMAQHARAANAGQTFVCMCECHSVPSIRGEAPKVEDLKEKFREILNDVFEEATTWDFTPEINKAVDRLYDAVTQIQMLDSH